MVKEIVSNIKNLEKEMCDIVYDIMNNVNEKIFYYIHKNCTKEMHQYLKDSNTTSIKYVKELIKIIKKEIKINNDEKYLKEQLLKQYNENINIINYVINYLFYNIYEYEKNEEQIDITKPMITLKRGRKRYWFRLPSEFII